MKRLIRFFSIIELMVVISVILVLGTLTLPLATNLYQTANAAVCKNNLKNIGSLCFVYASDNDGYLPGYSSGDAPISKGKLKFNQYYLNNLYGSWQGHLFPYIVPELQSYFRRSGVHKDGQVYMYNGKIPTGDTMKEAWQLVKDTYELGGYGNLKVLICPQAFKTEDLFTSSKYKGSFLPRVSGVTNGSKMKDKGFSCVPEGPTSYLANSVFFTDTYKFNNSNHNSRLSEVKMISQKTLLLEGNQPLEGSYQGNNPYFEPSDYIGIDSVKNSIKDDDERIFSYLHEGWDEYYVSSQFGGKYSGDMPYYIMGAFNKTFWPEAVMVSSSGDEGGQRIIVNGVSVKAFFQRQDVKDFFTGYQFSVQSSTANSTGMYLDITYQAGEMNVLKGDGAVKKEDISTVHDEQQNAYNKHGD